MTYMDVQANWDTKALIYTWTVKLLGTGDLNFDCLDNAWIIEYDNAHFSACVPI